MRNLKRKEEIIENGKTKTKGNKKKEMNFK